jgi:UDP-N-acetylmuramate: L-alanyl-gamma-D-glutamyl-meso-diaminopimelate ligase
VLAVSGTHGKTTTTSILAWILEYANLAPGFLIGGVPGNFDTSARLGGAPFFVIEADEYDTAFFDKRAKFVHYRPRTVILNNLEFDHADIYPDLAAIQRQFHHLVRIVPGGGRIIHNARDPNLDAVLKMGAWTPREGFARDPAPGVTWSLRLPAGGDYSRFDVLERDQPVGTVEWSLLGAHNAENALAAIAAARHAGVPVGTAIEALSQFRGIRRRMELRGVAGGISIYDDFAHHPTAIATTLDGLRRKVGAERIIAVMEPRSATMRLGVHRDTLAPSFAVADAVWIYAPADLGWDAAHVVAGLGPRGHLANDIDALVAQLVSAARRGDHVLIMSNGGFGGLHGKLLTALQARHGKG